MTNTVNAENAFHTVIAARAAHVTSAANKQLALSLATTIAMQKNTSFLEKMNVIASDFIDTKNAADKLCLYSIKQIANVLSALTKATERASLHDVSETVYVALRTMINFAKADKTFTKADLCMSIDASAKIDDSKKALIFHKKQKHDAAYASRQMTIALNVMRVLKLVSAKNKFEFEVNKSNAAYKALVKLVDESK